MNALTRRKRAVLRIRWRDQHRGGVTMRESEILLDNGLFRKLREMFPDASVGMVRKAVHMIQFQRDVRKLDEFEEYESPTPRLGQEPEFIIMNEVPYGE